MKVLGDDFGSWDCTEKDDQLICTYGGTLPSGAYLPILPVTVQAKNCDSTSFKAPVRLEVDGETATSNNSYSCSIGYVSPVEKVEEPDPSPEVLGEKDENYCDTFITGHVFHDENDNGVQDSNEADFPAVTVYITLEDGSVIAVETDENGDYEVCATPGTVSTSIDVNDSDLPDNPYVTTNNADQSREAIDGKVNAMDDVGISNDDGNVLATTGLYIGGAALVGFLSFTALFFIRRRKNSEVPTAK